MALISVITPTNHSKWLKLAYLSMKRQTLTDWEWIVLLNGKILQKTNAAECKEMVENDPRIKLIPFDGKTNEDGTINVGALKKRACSYTTAPYAVEFDHDDELSADCLQEVYDAFEKSKAAFVFSDAARNHQDGRPEIYGTGYGWEYSDREFNTGSGIEIHKVAKHPLCVPQNITRIWYAPDHVRAWRMDAYNLIGGHNENLKVCDDLDLICRLYQMSGGAFYHIEKVLYKYLIHGDNTWLKNQALIENLMWGIHDQFIQDFALMFWRGRGLRCLDLGGGINPPAGWEGVDKFNGAITADLEQDWPFETNSVGALRAHDLVEHISPSRVVHFMNEAYRVLHHGGLFLIEVPSTDGRGAFQDPSHVSFWNSNSFWYYTKAQTQHYIKHLGAVCRFQVVRMVNYFPSQWHKDHNIMYVKAHLAAIKEGERLHGTYEV